MNENFKKLMEKLDELSAVQDAIVNKIIEQDEKIFSIREKQQEIINQLEYFNTFDNDIKNEAQSGFMQQEVKKTEH